MVLGLPLAPVLALLCFVFRLLQVGPWPVWIAASLWLWFIEAKLGTTLALAGWVAVTVVIRSWLERKAVRLGDAVPKALLFLAVLGGLIAWGFSGMFLGAASISVAWTLMHSWLQLDRAEPTD
jgi:predicted PurR-regulated permease PerM